MKHLKKYINHFELPYPKYDKWTLLFIYSYDNFKYWHLLVKWYNKSFLYDCCTIKESPFIKVYF